MATISLTASKIDAVAACLEFGREQLTENFQIGMAEGYGDEWPDAANLMALNWADAALVLQALGKADDAVECERLSTRLYESAADASAKAREAKSTPDDDGIAAE